MTKRVTGHWASRHNAGARLAGSPDPEPAPQSEPKTVEDILWTDSEDSPRGYERTNEPGRFIDYGLSGLGKLLRFSHRRVTRHSGTRG